MGAPARLKGRRVAPPAGAESVEIRAKDGLTLRATVREAETKRALGTCVLAHAMFARRTEFEKGGFGAFLARLGWRSVAFDFRGHGDSERPESWGYDDLVFLDLPAVVDAVRARSSGPVVIVGHSLGGHVAMASQGVGALGADAIVGLAANVWLRELEPSAAIWAVKRSMIRAIDAIAARTDPFPARALRQGSDDESARYMRDLARFALTGAWRSADGRYDYLASLARVAIPVASIASDGDRLNARPECVRRLLALCGGPTRFVHARAADAGGRAPGHMALVTTGACERAWAEAMRWIADAIG